MGEGGFGVVVVGGAVVVVGGGTVLVTSVVGGRVPGVVVHISSDSTLPDPSSSVLSNDTPPSGLIVFPSVIYGMDRLTFRAQCIYCLLGLIRINFI